jgi:hypothetical protein
MRREPEDGNDQEKDAPSSSLGPSSDGGGSFRDKDAREELKAELLRLYREFLAQYGVLFALLRKMGRLRDPARLLAAVGKGKGKSGRER